MKNILFITAWYPTANNPAKGIFIKEHAKAISTQGYNVTVLCINVEYSTAIYQTKSEYFIDEAGIHTHIIHIRSKFYKWIYIQPFWMYYKIISYLKKNILPNYTPDLYHAHVIYPAGIIGFWIARQYHKPLILTEHWSKFKKFFTKTLWSFYGKKSIAYASKITTVSQFLSQQISEIIKDKPISIEIIPNAVNTEIFHYKEKNLPADILVFTCISTWNTKTKRIDIIVNTLEKVSHKLDKKIILNIIGEGSYLQAIKENKYSFEIRYWGYLNKHEISNILHQSHFLLHATDIETFSVVIAEALCTGTPVVASCVGAIPERINETNGVLTNNSIDEWEDAIMKAIQTTYNYQHISQESIRQYFYENVGKMFDAVYQSLLH